MGSPGTPRRHYLVPAACRSLTRVGVWGITTGPNFAIRAWTVFEKDPPQLW
ncbi:MAG: hypothetical protein KGK34_07330 [Chloroflexota bacterium]|nr:hypothetical protein [Chloroflexota bacterium]